MRTSFRRLGLGVVFAILLVYLLMVVNFQSWLDPFIILMALPGAFAGILWMLFVTQTTIQRSVADGFHHVQSVWLRRTVSLMVAFANDERLTGMDEIEAALVCGLYPHPPRSNDGDGDGDRHGPDGARFG